MYSVSPSPSVLIKVNSILSVCSSADCVYSFITSTPEVTSQTVDARGVTISVSVNDPLNRNLLISNSFVSLDNQPCSILSGTLASFTCNVPVNSFGVPLIKAGSYNISVFINDYGYIKIRPRIATINYDLVLNSLDLNRGGTNGGYEIRIFGKGFPTDSGLVKITLCGVEVLILSI